MGRDEVIVGIAEIQQRAGQGVEQGDVAAGASGRWRLASRAVGVRRGSMTATYRSGLALRGPDAVEQHGVRFGHVAADDQDHVGVLNVVVAARRSVAAEAGAVAGHGGGHAQPAVGVGVVGVQSALEELADEVRGLGVELAAAVEGDRIGAVGVQDVGETFGGVAQGGVPAGCLELFAALCGGCAGISGGRGRGSLAEQQALGANAAEVGGGVEDAADLHSRCEVALELATAADATVRTDGFRL